MHNVAYNWIMHILLFFIFWLHVVDEEMYSVFLELYIV